MSLNQGLVSYGIRCQGESLTWPNGSPLKHVGRHYKDLASISFVTARRLTVHRSHGRLRPHAAHLIRHLGLRFGQNVSDLFQ